MMESDKVNLLQKNLHTLYLLWPMCFVTLPFHTDYHPSWVCVYQNNKDATRGRLGIRIIRRFGDCWKQWKSLPRCFWWIWFNFCEDWLKNVRWDDDDDLQWVTFSITAVSVKTAKRISVFNRHTSTVCYSHCSQFCGCWLRRCTGSIPKLFGVLDVCSQT